MSRPIRGKVVVRGELCCRGPLAVGGLAVDEAVDLTLAQNGRGNYYVPGSSLAGPMRALLREALGVDKENEPPCGASDVDEEKALLCLLFGFQDDRKHSERSAGKGSPDNGQASLLIVDDAEITPLCDAPRWEPRDGVAIDRVSGAASHGLLHSRAVIPPDSRIPLRLELDLPLDDGLAQKCRHALGWLLGHMQEHGLRLGGGKTRGLGLVTLECPEFRVYDFCRDGKKESKEDLFAWLTDDEKPSKKTSNDPSKLLAAHLKKDFSAPPYVRASIEWRALGPLMVKSGREGQGIKALPLMGATGCGDLAAVLPGSSIKGALRARAERIMRTVLDPKKFPENELAGCADFAKQIKVPLLDQIKVPLVRELFGTTANAGLLTVEDVYHQRKVKAEAWLAEKFDKKTFAQRDHVAIDRFTGGAADGLLFSELSPPPDQWSPLVIRLEFPRRSEAGKDRSGMAMCALLLLLLRDMQDGLLPLGYGVNRGLGQIELTKVSWKAAGALPDGGGDLGEIFHGRAGAKFPFGVEVTELNEAWTAWVTSNNGGGNGR
ncbi:protein of unknown function DUF324 [Desulfarculus baarsii DSM 2075]|uniref:CRISPR type III-associated protein domain-containing protein n=1 Tax=Desulfarculus baarsii (strain ATCC 33931 / DSM 2075 / LMG 7858 / VKM B-1802 / 2st14) TaxID=644282 RepID=E1QGM8_DESB2|nr:RAMP superfamily CRISPR-associated protein [Desulfarculus baarsii]ADK84721.1 protein of unknown function DUF324 [Desulfarculus baarsii DSM 2075]